MTEEIRTFDTGANRGSEEGKLDYEGFLSPLVLERYAEYLHGHRELPDGTVRASDNWQKGMPLGVYMESGWRHFFSWWKAHRGWFRGPLTSEVDREKRLEDAICALIFNASGYLHEVLKKKLVEQELADSPLIVVPPKEGPRPPRPEGTPHDPRKYGAGRMSDVDTARKISEEEMDAADIVAVPLEFPHQSREEYDRLSADEETIDTRRED